jgi:hypothetical protein
MKLLEKLSEMFPKQWQDKVMAAYVGRALSLDLPQLYRNIRYGMRVDPIVGRMELAELDWNEVNQERLSHIPISEIVDEAEEDAVREDPFFGHFRRADHLIEKLGEDGPGYAEALREMEMLDSFSNIDYGDTYRFDDDLSEIPLYLNIGHEDLAFGGGYRRSGSSAGSIA